VKRNKVIDERRDIRHGTICQVLCVAGAAPGQIRVFGLQTLAAPLET
jgi:hypothetical protein